MEWSKICKPKKEQELNKIKRVLNHTMVLGYAKGLGIVAVNISPEDCAEGRPTALNSILWQLIREDLTKSLNIVHFFDAIALKRADETVVEFMNQQPLSLLLRWVNNRLESKNIKVTNLGEEWRNGYLFHQLVKTVSKGFTDEDEAMISEAPTDGDKIQALLEVIDRLDLNKKSIMLEPEDILYGEKHLIMSLISSIFYSCDHSDLVLEQSEETLDTLKNEIFENSIAILGKEIPDVNTRPEMKAFLALIKNVSNFETTDMYKKLEIHMRKQIEKLESDNTSLLTTNDKLQQENENQQTKIITLQERVSHLEQSQILATTQLQETKSQLDSTLSELDTYKSQVQDLKQRLAIEIERVKQFTEGKSLNLEKEKLEKEKKEMEENMIKEKQEMAETLEKERQEMEEKLAQEKQTLAEQYTKDKQEVEEKLDESRKENLQLASALLTLKEQHEKSKNDVQTLLKNSGENAGAALAEMRFGSNPTVQTLKHMRPVKAGYMEKQGSNFKSWKKRYCLLFKEFLFYFSKDAPNEKPKGIVVIDPKTRARNVEDESKKGFTFVVISGARNLNCCVDSAEERDSWVEAIEQLHY